MISLPEQSSRNMKVCFLIFLFSMLMPDVSHAGAYVMPVSVVDTHVTQKIVSWTESPETPNPCYRSFRGCYIGPDVLYSTHAPGLKGSCNSFGNCIEISKYRTAKEVVDAYNKAHPIPFTASFDIHPQDATCVGLFYVTHEPVEYREDATRWPGSTCGKLPPVNQSCHLSIPSTIDFGTVSAGSVNGVERHITGFMKCQKAASLKMYAYSARKNTKGVSFNQDGTLTGDLHINGEDAFKGVAVSVPGDNHSKDFDFSVRLASSKVVDAGEYSAIALVIASFN